MPTLAILKAGQHTDSHGKAITVDKAQLEKIAQAYEPDKHEAPLVLGHPSHNAPAFGWVKSLSVQDKTLNAELGQIHDDVIDMVRDGAYKKISASFYPAESSLNPAPGQMSLRHVGLLGAEPPAIKGLPAINFAETPSTTIETEKDSGAITKLIDWIVQKFGAEAASEAETLLQNENENENTDDTKDQQNICFAEVATAPPFHNTVDDVQNLIKQAHHHIAEAHASGRTLGFAEAVTIAQKNK